MAKKNTNKKAPKTPTAPTRAAHGSRRIDTTKKAEPIKVAPIVKAEKPKVKEIKVAKKPIERLEGSHMVNFASNGLSRYLRKAGKIHIVTADHAQLLIDKGYGHVV